MTKFNEVIHRQNTQSYKWDKMADVYQLEDASNILPMWVADMDFATPPVVIEAIQERLQHPVFGYSFVSENCKQAIVQWFSSRHQWTIDPQTLLFHQGVVPAIASIMETFTAPGDKVAISSPVYHPFTHITKAQGRTLVECPLQEVNSSYTFDFLNLEQEFKNGVKLYILCNPHNPAGIVWSRAQLEHLVKLCIQYDVYLLSDEIHADILFGTSYTPIFTVKDAGLANIICCIAPTKTFNIAGIQGSMMVVPNTELRTKLEQNAQAHGQAGLNALAIAAIEAAYTNGAPWLDELLDYLSININYVSEQLNALDGISVAKPEGTYLMWIDYRETGFTEEEIMHRLLTIGKLGLEPGSKYGVDGIGFLRMNIACPFTTLRDGVERFKKAYKR